MDENCPATTQQISQDDWERTPASVKQLVEEMQERIRQLEQKLVELEAEQQQLIEKTNRTSKNSSVPSSSDPLSTPKQERKRKSGKKRGGQPGHSGHSRPLYPIEQCESVTDHYPTTCASCGEKPSGEDSNPYRHQIVEIPPISPIVVEHRLHQLGCSHCGNSTRATLPEEISPSGYGARVVAMVALLSGQYRHSQRMVQSALADLFGISMSLGTVNSLRQEASDAVAYPVEETHRYVQQQPVVGADETSFAQGNVDRCNPKLRQVAAVSPGFSKSREVRSELWVAVTPLVTFFQIALSRCSEAALRLLGEDFGGILTSDRHGAYNWVDLERRQLCWAHLKREFIKISERPGVSGQLGAALVKQQEKLFELWHRVRDGTLARHDFQVLVLEIRFSIKALLQEAADHEIGSKEKTPLAKTVRTCRQLLKVEPAMWLFVSVEGVEPTNNAAERAIRPAVIWRRTSFGSQTQTGSAFVARMLTVVTTLKSQQRNVLEFMTQAVIAAREGQPAPSLLPEVATSSNNSELLKAA